jgi:hypothetical protein
MPSRTLVVTALVVASSLACGRSDGDPSAAARADEWGAIEREHAALEDLRSRLAAVEDGGLAAEVDQSTERFLERLVAFINHHAGAQSGGSAPELAGALRLKSAEDVLLAREYIERGGDYAKAIDILESAKLVDPGNAELEAELYEAKRLRYMDPERFARVEKGMSEEDVRRELGQVKPQNVREYEEGGGTVVWFYPKPGGAAAAVYFRRGEGQLRVFDANFDAVPSAAERGADGGSDERPSAN